MTLGPGTYYALTISKFQFYPEFPIKPPDLILHFQVIYLDISFFSSLVKVFQLGWLIEIQVSVKNEARQNGLKIRPKIRPKI